MGKEHEHNFVAEKYTVQESKNEYIGNSRYQVVTLDIQKVVLFCTRCGQRLEQPTPSSVESEKEK